MKNNKPIYVEVIEGNERIYLAGRTLSLDRLPKVVLAGVTQCFKS